MERARNVEFVETAKSFLRVGWPACLHLIRCSASVFLIFAPVLCWRLFDKPRESDVPGHDLFAQIQPLAELDAVVKQTRNLGMRSFP